MIYLFDSKEMEILKVGGKAKALMQTYQVGLGVPEGIVLSVDFFTEWMHIIKKSDEWKQLLENTNLENCKNVISLTDKLQFSDKMKQIFENNISSLIEGEDEIFSVRSSSPEEDLEGSSFAGMYETYLGVKIKDLEFYVKSAFSSCFSFRVMEYKKQRNIKLENTQIAVIVQKQINSDISGIGFSINPLNNCYDEVLINASFGLGEYIVSGKVTPDEYIVEKYKEEIIDKKINEKHKKLAIDEKGQLKEETINTDKQVLDEKKIIEVTNLIKKCEKYYDKPIDIEWAYEDDKLYLLQCRPITTYFKLYPELLTEYGEQKLLYLDMIKYSQGFQWSMSELGSDLFTELLDKAKQGIMPRGKDGVSYNNHGRIYILFGNMARAVGARRVIDMFAPMDPNLRRLDEIIDLKDYVPNEKTEKVKQIKWDILRLALKIIPPIASTALTEERKEQSIKEYYELRTYAFRQFDLYKGRMDSLENQVYDVFEIFSGLTDKMSVYIFAMTALNSLKKLFDDESLETDIINLGLNQKSNPTAIMGKLQLQLAEFEEFKQVENSNEFINKVQQRQFSDEFMDIYDEYMKYYGCRGIGEIDIATKRIYERLDDFYVILKQLNTNEDIFKNMEDRKKSSYEKLLKIAKEKGKEKKFEKLVYNLGWMGLREDPKYMYIYAVDILRQNVLKMAESFVKENQLVEKEDVFYLNVNQIVRAQKDREFDLKPLVKQEKEIRKIHKNRIYFPEIFDSRGKIINIMKKSTDGKLMGIPISPGVIRGKAKVLMSPFEKKLEKDEILVTVATEPSWTPIFINASAVVMEIGGALQHGAIIAREYGIPCVSGIDKVTQKIKDGDLIEVDGTNGTVKIIN